MEINRKTVVIDSRERITPDNFEKILRDADSPARDEARAAYDAVKAKGVDPLFALAIFKHESNFGKLGICAKYSTRNPGNTRSSRTGQGTIIDTERGKFVKYPDWTEGFRDLAQRLVDPEYVYALENRKTIEEILPRWAPASDNNSPESYIAAVIQFMSEGDTLPDTAGKCRLRIAVSAGHHNTDGGNPTEQKLTGRLCQAYTTEFLGRGWDVFTITPDGPDFDNIPGNGLFRGGLQAVAQQIVNKANEGWVADLFLEAHTEGVKNTAVRGVFAIFPDWGNDVDGELRDNLGPTLAQAISDATGIPVRNVNGKKGVMSEKETQVGMGGDRLGIFLITAPLRNTTTRLIIEHGAHSSPLNLPILDEAETPAKIAKAVADVLENFFPAFTVSEPDVIRIPETGKSLGFGFKDYWKRLESTGDQLNLRALGFPITDEFKLGLTPSSDPQTVQLFERGALVWDKTQPEPWNIHQTSLKELIQVIGEAIEKNLLDAARATELSQLLK